MAGIIQDTQDPAAAAPAAPPNPTQSGAEAQEPTPDQESPQEDSSEQPNVSPEEQKVYDTVVTGLLNLVYSDTGFPATIQKLNSFREKGPAFAIGHTAAMLVMSMKKTTEKAGKQIPDDILFAAAQELVGDLVKISEGIGLITAEQAQTIGEPAFYEGMKVFGQSMQDNGQITPEIQASAKADLAASGHPVPAGQAAQAPQAAPPQSTPPTGIVNQSGATQ